MSRNLTYRSTREARQPVVVTFDDGRRFELPGDIEADGFLSFAESYGRFLEGDSMPVHVIAPFFKAVLPEAQYSELRKQLSIRELTRLAQDLWPIYFGGGEEDTEASPLPST